MGRTRYCIIFRMGGTENFSWHRAFDTHPTREQAEVAAEGVRKMGYKTLVADYDLSLSVGLPETYEYEAGR